MKPRTKREARVMALSATLPQYSNEYLVRGAAKYSQTGRLTYNGRSWCSECGQSFDGAPKKCPHCHARLTNLKERRLKFDTESLHVVLTTCKEFQVFRVYMAQKTMRYGKQPTYSFCELMQVWISEDAKETVLARNRKGLYYNWMWDMDSELSVKANDRSPYGRYNRFDVYLDSFTVARILPKLKQHGFNPRWYGCASSTQAKALLVDREAESLAKRGLWSILEYKMDRCIGEFKLPFQHSIRIAHKHGYEVKDAGTWFDYLSLLSRAGKDTHSPKLICPENLDKAHDKLLKKVKLREAIEEAAKDEGWYAEQRKAYIGIAFGDDDVSISVIPTVADVALEGEKMHHCVFKCDYWKRKDSLLMSAKAPDGSRLETIELSLETMQVLQSRGLSNQPSPMHSRILELVTENVSLIAEAKKKAEQSAQTA